MALLGVSYSLTHNRAVAREGPHFQCVTNCVSCCQPSHKRFSSNRVTFAGVPFQAGVSCGLWVSKRKLDTALPKFRTRRRTVTGVGVRALQGEGRAPRRLVDVLRAVPKISRVYFRSPFRRALYGGISLLLGFYVAQTISLSFGALGVNDVIAAALCVLFAEYVTKFYHTRPKMTFTVALLNNFKMGVTYGLFIDAFKLAS